MRYDIDFKGYWRDEMVSTMPTYSGIYFVYRCTYNSDQDVVSLKELIYVGQADNLKKRICDHRSHERFQKQLLAGETLCYSCAKVDKEDIAIVHRALLLMQQPVLNRLTASDIKFGRAEFHLTGRCELVFASAFNIHEEKRL